MAEPPQDGKIEATASNHAVYSRHSSPFSVISISQRKRRRMPSSGGGATCRPHCPETVPSRDGSEIDFATAIEVRHGEPGASDSQSDTRFERAISVTQ